MTNPAAPIDHPPGEETVFAIQRDLPSPAAAFADEDDYLPDLFEAPDPPADTRAAGSVAWARSDRASPCYSHLLEAGKDQVAVQKSFEIGKAEIELLIAANRYAPRGKDDIIAFGLRGARLRGEESFEDEARLPLEDARPDHRNFRCVVGYYFRSSGTFSAFTGSTVPWQGYMAAGTIKYNLLSPGCYVYKKGTHMPVTRSRWVTPALRLSDASGAHSGAATVLRNKRDLVFDVTDSWDYCTPADNIHCAYSNSKFSSLGCQTIKGGMNDGLWADFAATLRKLPENARVDYMLFTGAEASMAASFVKSGRTATDLEVLTQLGRLRVGSTGDEVKLLQERLGETPTGYFGPATKKKLVELQAANGMSADGVYSPAIDLKLGWLVLNEHRPAAPIVVAQPSTQPPPVTVPAPAAPADPLPPASVTAPPPAVEVPVAQAPAAAPAPSAAPPPSPPPAPVVATAPLSHGSAEGSSPTPSTAPTTTSPAAGGPSPAVMAALGTLAAQSAPSAQVGQPAVPAQTAPPAPTYTAAPAPPPDPSATVTAAIGHEGSSPQPTTVRSRNFEHPTVGGAGTRWGLALLFTLLAALTAAGLYVLRYGP